MNYQILEGNYMHMGVSKETNRTIFTLEGEKEDSCKLVLVNKVTLEETSIDIPKEYCLGSLRSMAVRGISIRDYYYYYRINGEKVLDPYAPVIAGREIWNDKRRMQEDYSVFGAALEEHFNWKDDRNPEIDRSKVVMYKLHVRGFSIDRGAVRSGAGTFSAVEQKIPYLKSLGITTLELMPVYEFEEMPVPNQRQKLPDYLKNKAIQEPIREEKKQSSRKKINYWGYGPGNYFAVKASYAKNPERASYEFKHLIRRLHENGIECVMEMYFPKETNHNLIVDALRYWVKEYHVDGFHLLGEMLPITAIVQDVILSRTKIFYVEIPASMQHRNHYDRLFVYKEEYQYSVRKILNHINPELREVLNQQKKQGDTFGYVNYIASNNGFTLADVFAYNDKHNEDNGEGNVDGDTWNFSNNYGVEGPTRKRFITQIRQRQWRNAILMLFLAQGVPMIWAGDEFGNSQSGNNNAYCQDNPIGWVNWKKNGYAASQIDFVRKISAFRAKHPVLSQKKPFLFADYRSLGFPDLSCHGENAWLSGIDDSRMSLGLLYSGAYVPEGENDDDIYVAYNFYSNEVRLALPKMAGRRRWYKVIDTSLEKDAVIDDPVVREGEDQQFVMVAGQSICVLIGKEEKLVKSGRKKSRAVGKSSLRKKKDESVETFKDNCSS